MLRVSDPRSRVQWGTFESGAIEPPQHACSVRHQRAVEPQAARLGRPLSGHLIATANASSRRRPSLDHLVRLDAQQCGDDDSDLACAPQIDDQLEAAGLLNGEV